MCMWMQNIFGEILMSRCSLCVYSSLLHSLSHACIFSLALSPFLSPYVSSPTVASPVPSLPDWDADDKDEGKTPLATARPSSALCMRCCSYYEVCGLERDSMWLSVCLSVCLSSFCLPGCLFVGLSVPVSLPVSVTLSASLSVPLSVSVCGVVLWVVNLFTCWCWCITGHGKHVSLALPMKDIVAQ